MITDIREEDIVLKYMLFQKSSELPVDRYVIPKSKNKTVNNVYK